MNPISFLVVLLLAAAASGSLFGGDKNEQNGRFHLYKVKPRNDRDVEILLKADTAYVSQPFSFLLNLIKSFSFLFLLGFQNFT